MKGGRWKLRLQYDTQSERERVCAWPKMRYGRVMKKKSEESIICVGKDEKG